MTLRFFTVRAAAFSTLAVLAACASAQSDGERLTQVQTAAVSAVDVHYVGVLTNGQGSLLLRGTDTDSVSVRYAVSSTSRSALFRNQVETIDKEDSIFVAIRPAAHTSMDLQVEMPEHVTLGLRDEARDVVVRNIRSRVEVALHAGGSLDIDEIEGPLTIMDGGGPIRIREVRGPVVIRDDGGTITIQDVTDEVKIDSHGGDLTLENVGGDVTLSLGSGALTIHGVKGKVSYHKTGAGKVTIENVAGGVERL